MEKALVLAETAYDQGQFPVGCVIVARNRVVATGARRGTGPDQVRFSEIDHAEIRALRALEVSGAGAFDPAQAVIYTTMEPCLMCFGAILISRIKTVVYAYEDAMGGGTGCDLAPMPPLYKNAGVRIVPGVLRQKSLDLFYNFFNKDTNLYWKDSFLETYTREQKVKAGVQG